MARGARAAHRTRRNRYATPERLDPAASPRLARSVRTRRPVCCSADARVPRPVPPPHHADSAARASHVLLKHENSRRLSSWRDPDGVEIKARTEAEASRQLKAWRAAIERGEKSIDDLARKFSDCDTAEQGGDLGWFPAGYMQHEFEEATLALEVGQLSDVVATASGFHLILRTG